MSTADGASVDPHAAFLFDLNGFIVVKGVLSPEEVSALNVAIDAHSSEVHNRPDGIRNTVPGSPLEGDAQRPRRDLGGMLGWDEPDFRRLLAHPKLLPYLHLFLGRGYRLDHYPTVICQDPGSEGFSLHGGPLDSEGSFNPALQYGLRHGRFWQTLMAMSVVLTPHGPGDGGFCVVRGSHKLNLPVPKAMAHGYELRDQVEQPVTSPGDVIFFSEATVHGALPWSATHERRIVLYRFSPANVAYARGYLTWPETVLQKCTVAERAVLEPPYGNRSDRPELTDAGEMRLCARSEAKKNFDIKVHGSTYF